LRDTIGAILADRPDFFVRRKIFSLRGVFFLNTENSVAMLRAPKAKARIRAGL
jgi:hypothetical protein